MATPVVAPVVTPVATPVVQPVQPVLQPVVQPVQPVVQPVQPVVQPVQPIVQPIQPVVQPVQPVVQPVVQPTTPVIPAAPIKRIFEGEGVVPAEILKDDKELLEDSKNGSYWSRYEGNPHKRNWFHPFKWRRFHNTYEKGSWNWYIENAKENIEHGEDYLED